MCSLGHGFPRPLNWKQMICVSNSAGAGSHGRFVLHISQELEQEEEQESSGSRKQKGQISANGWNVTAAADVALECYSGGGCCIGMLHWDVTSLESVVRRCPGNYS